MKNIKDLTEKDCIHCATQEEWDAVAMLLINRKFDTEYENGTNCIRRGNGVTYFYSLESAHYHNYTIHPASDFLTPQVNVLTEIGDTKVIRHNDGCIVIKDDKAMTLTKDIVNWIRENV
jgi:hypothetical protein